MTMASTSEILSNRLLFILERNSTITIRDTKGYIEDLNVPADIGNLIGKICVEHGEQARELENLNKHNPLGRLRLLIEFLKQHDDLDSDLLIQCVASAYDFDK